MKNDAAWMIAGLVGLWFVLTRSYAGYKYQETDSVADRYINNPRLKSWV